jgi:hypothetical protein
MKGDCEILLNNENESFILSSGDIFISTCFSSIKFVNESDKEDLLIYNINIKRN